MIKNCKDIYVYDVSGKLLNILNFRNEEHSKMFSKSDKASIYKCIKDNVTMKGKIFSYKPLREEEVKKYKIIIDNRPRYNNKDIIIFDSVSNVTLKFNNMDSVIKSLNIKINSLYALLSGRQRIIYSRFSLSKTKLK